MGAKHDVLQTIELYKFNGIYIFAEWMNAENQLKVLTDCRSRSRWRSCRTRIYWKNAVALILRFSFSSVIVDFSFLRFFSAKNVPRFSPVASYLVGVLSGYIWILHKQSWWPKHSPAHCAIVSRCVSITRRI